MPKEFKKDSVVLFPSFESLYIARVEKISGKILTLKNLSVVIPIPSETSGSVNIQIRPYFLQTLGIIRRESTSSYEVNLDAIPLIHHEEDLDPELVRMFKSRSSGLVLPETGFVA